MAVGEHQDHARLDVLLSALLLLVFVAALALAIVMTMSL